MAAAAPAAAAAAAAAATTAATAAVATFGAAGHKPHERQKLRFCFFVARICRVRDEYAKNIRFCARAQQQRMRRRHRRRRRPQGFIVAEDDERQAPFNRLLHQKSLKRGFALRVQNVGAFRFLRLRSRLPHYKILAFAYAAAAAAAAAAAVAVAVFVVIVAKMTAILGLIAYGVCSRARADRFLPCFRHSNV